MYEQLIGKTLEEAIKFLTERGIRWQVSAENGRSVVLTMDHNPQRINLHVVDGVIVSYRFG